jgi:uncharacterized protein (TIGR00369 family)
MSIEQIRARFARIGFAAYLGVDIVEIEHERAVIHLPFREAHTNPGGILNGGVTVSLMNLAGTLAAWTGIDLAAEPFLGTVDLTIQYVAAAIEEDVWGAARVVRRGRDLFFFDTSVRNHDDTPICQGLMIYRAPNYAGQSRRLFARPELFAEPPSTGATEPALRLGPFLQKLRIATLHDSPGRVRLRMPWMPDLADERGYLHEGALASLLDIAGTAASWTLAQRPGSRGATIGMQLSFLNPVREAVIADAIVQQRSEELFFSHVQITTVAARQLVAMGNVSYRILEARQGG